MSLWMEGVGLDRRVLSWSFTTSQYRYCTVVGTTQDVVLQHSTSYIRQYWKQPIAANQGRDIANLRASLSRARDRASLQCIAKNIPC